jgi:hypothetical protein
MILATNYATWQRGIAQNSARHTVIITGNKYESLLRIANKIERELNIWRPSQYARQIVDSEARTAGIYAEIAFEWLLKASRVRFKRPTNENGQRRDPVTMSDYGDFEINGEVYDIKSSPIHSNCLCSVKPKHVNWKTPISWIVGSYTHVERNKRKVTVYFYGVVHVNDIWKLGVDKIEGKPAVPSCRFAKFPINLQDFTSLK